MIFLEAAAAAVAESFADKVVLALIAAAFALAGGLVLKLLTDSSTARKDEMARVWGAIDKGTDEADKIEHDLYAKIDDVKDTIVDIQKALYRIEADQRAATELHQFWVDAVRLNVAPSVPRENPLTTDTNRTVAEWTAGLAVSCERKAAAAVELKHEAGVDLKLTEAERISFSMTAAALWYEAAKEQAEASKARLDL